MDTQAYQDAKDALKVQDYKVAEHNFKIVLDSIDEHHEQYNSVLSNYGLSQVLVSDKNGLLLCREAAGNEIVEGDVFLNLACAELESGDRKRAIDAIHHGVKIDADNEKLKYACATLECRKKYFFSFLPRNNKLNQLVGRMLRRTPPEITAHSLLY